VLGIEAILEPLTKTIVLRMRSIVQDIKKLSKAVRTATILRRTTPGSRQALALERFVRIEDLLQQKLVLPAVTKVVLVEQLCPRRIDQVPQLRPVRLFSLLEYELMQV
jgi:hypothetical protein